MSWQLLNRISIRFLLAIMVMFFVGAIIIYATSGSNQQTINGSSEAQSSSKPVPASTAVPASNVDAIMPHSNTVPAFTAEDVKRYFQTHTFPGGPTTQGQPIRVDTVQFLRAGDARSRFLQGENLGVPDTELVCYVVLDGPFTLTNVELPPGTKSAQVPVVQKGVEVFDARTGNMLLWGTPLR
jgi:hypothetical protein